MRDDLIFVTSVFRSSSTSDWSAKDHADDEELLRRIERMSYLQQQQQQPLENKMKSRVEDWKTVTKEAQPFTPDNRSTKPEADPPNKVEDNYAHYTQFVQNVHTRYPSMLIIDPSPYLLERDASKLPSNVELLRTKIKQNHQRSNQWVVFVYKEEAHMTIYPWLKQVGGLKYISITVRLLPEKEPGFSLQSEHPKEGKEVVRFTDTATDTSLKGGHDAKSYDDYLMLLLQGTQIGNKQRKIIVTEDFDLRMNQLKDADKKIAHKMLRRSEILLYDSNNTMLMQSSQFKNDNTFDTKIRKKLLSLFKKEGLH